MNNILNVKDILDSMNNIEVSCEIGGSHGTRDIDHKKFYDQVKGLMTLLEVNLNNKKGGGMSA